MKVLLGSCISGGAAVILQVRGHDVERVGDWPVDPGDDEILKYAAENARIVVTLDKDFGELAVLHGFAHCGIVRLVGFSAQEQGAVCCHIVARYAGELEAAAIITVTPDRVRIRPAC